MRLAILLTLVLGLIWLFLAWALGRGRAFLVFAIAGVLALIFWIGNALALSPALMALLGITGVTVVLTGWFMYRRARWEAFAVAFLMEAVVVITMLGMELHLPENWILIAIGALFVAPVVAASIISLVMTFLRYR